VDCLKKLLDFPLGVSSIKNCLLKKFIDAFVDFAERMGHSRLPLLTTGLEIASLLNVALYLDCFAESIGNLCSIEVLMCATIWK